MKRQSVVLCVVAVIAIALMFHHKPQSRAGAHIGGAFSLSDTHGGAVKSTDFHGRVMLVYMGYTHCPDICPATLTAMGEALKSLGPDAAGVAPLFITVDPARDTPQVLARYLASFDSRIIGLTGAKPAIDQVMREYRVYYKPKNASADYAVDHSGNLYVMDKSGKFETLLHSDARPEAIAQALKEALAK